MKDCPIKFHHNGKEYSGYFSPVNGAGSSSMFHLMIDGYYYGQLFYTDTWKFYSNSEPQLSELEDYFGEVVTAWGQ